MDSFREHPSDPELTATEAPPADDVAAAIGTDERRMHVRAYNYWVSLLEGRDFPSIEDLEPGDVQDFAANSVLLDFTCGRDNPAVPYIGGAIREECGLDESTRTIGDVPSRSLLSRLTDHYLQIIANRAPIGFEAEFVNQRGDNICYRGILMPFSSDGDTIDFIYGVINWKTEDGSAVAAAEPDLVPAESAPAEFGAEVPMVGADEDPTTGFAPVGIEEALPAAVAPPPEEHLTWEDGPLGDASDQDEIPIPSIELGEDAGLADRLSAARETAEAAKSADGRTRAALYRALALAYDFAVAARDNPEDYAELLEESGVKAQARAPMTPIVKLVFGIDYDKARLTEFAAALSYAQRQSVEAGGFLRFIEQQAGGLKALVAAEREARRPEPRADTRGEEARAKLRAAPAISLAELPSADEFAVVVTRRGADGQHQPVAIIDDEALVERAIRRAL
ncbi:MAG TPA: hypothetical protein VJM15_04230 [Sphingomicrobium sp.]|nr:hypothetical protein [Sphingomicrobium sp.]